LKEVATSPPFKDRFALASLPDGGVLVDLATGAYSRLNPSGAIVCEALATTETVGAAAAIVSARLGITAREAEEAVGHLLEAVNEREPRRDRRDPFRYAADAGRGGYVLSSMDVPRLWLSQDGLTIRSISEQPASEQQTFEYLRAAAPKLLFLQGAAVLHGAACSGARGLTAFCGDSGAGKTTTARAFGAAGRAVFSEDMLAVASPSPLAVHLGGEDAIRAWAREAAQELLRTSRVEASGLKAALAGTPVPVSEVWFIAAAHRLEGPGPLAPRRLGATDGTLAVMTGLFLGATSAPEWRRFMALAQAIATSTPLYEARMPRGIEALQSAAKDYTQNSAS
jgi:hypothetical protein